MIGSSRRPSRRSRTTQHRIDEQPDPSHHHNTACDRASPVPCSWQSGGPFTASPWQATLSALARRRQIRDSQAASRRQSATRWDTTTRTINPSCCGRVIRPCVRITAVPGVIRAEIRTSSRACQAARRPICRQLARCGAITESKSNVNALFSLTAMVRGRTLDLRRRTDNLHGRAPGGTAPFVQMVTSRGRSLILLQRSRPEGDRVGGWAASGNRARQRA